MSIFTTNLLADLAAIIVALALVIITYFKWSYQYWKRRNLPYLEPKFPFGCLENPSKRTKPVGESVNALYKEIKSKNLKHSGVYFMASPVYYPIDLDYIKNITTKDFHHFVDRGIYYNEKTDPISAHLFAIGGVKWRNLRTKLTPTFTSGKMKGMFQTLVECGHILEKVMDRKVTEGESVDIKEVLGCFTTDIIGSCAFGLDCKTFQDEDSEFRKYGKKVFTQTRTRAFITAFAINFPDIGRLFGVRQVEKDISDFFTKVVTDTVNYREKNNVVRKDFLQLLIELKNNEISKESGDGKTLTLTEVVAQSFIFFLAGFETSSTTMTFALYELARNPEIQEKTREEVVQVLKRHNGEMSYDAINELKYMGQVIDETLRKYPPVPFITRRCVEDYKIPDEDLVIEKGTRVVIPIQAIHYDEEFYPEPKVFDPERFSDENKRQRHQYAHIPFGEGPRICIGMRFGIMQTKVGLATILKNYQFSVSKKTQVPLKMSITSFIPSTEGDMWLDFKKI